MNANYLIIFLISFVNEISLQFHGIVIRIFNRTPLMSASLKGNKEIFQLLFQHPNIVINCVDILNINF